MTERLSQTWNLDTLFPGGSSSPELQAFLQQITTDIAEWRQHLHNQKAPQTDTEALDLLPLIELGQHLDARLEEAADFAYCLIAQNTGDAQAKRIFSEATKLRADYKSAQVRFEELLEQTPDNVFENLIAHPQVAPVAFYLQELRDQRKSQLPAAQEVLANDLSVDGYHAWTALQKTIIGNLRIPFEVKGELQQLSLPQLGKHTLDADRSVRQQAAAAMQEALEPQTEVLASVLNHMAGFRLQLVKHRGEASPLQAALRAYRMSEQTLNTMWSAIEQNLPRLTPYYERKARLLGLDKMNFYDINAPLPTAAADISYEEVMDFIKEQFGIFSPRMREYVEKAVESNWLDVRNTAEKIGGAFCAYFPTRNQQRVFYTLSGKAYDIRVLAHELGHGYHASLVEDLPYFAQRFPTNLAETASTFGEMVATDAALRQAKTTEERIDLLHNRIQNVVLYLPSIFNMYSFEKLYYTERAKGLVPVERLEELYLSTQKTAYADALGEYQKFVWARHGHLYNSERAFYNFPYTFGYLFSTGIYAQALQEGPGFAERYNALLRDTGSMTVEALAEKHLGADLTQPAFWQAAIDHVMNDVEEFLKLTAE